MKGAVAEKAKMVGASALARDFGFTPRHWIAQAAAGKIPGAYQPSGARGKWVFDRAVFERWWAGRLKEVSAWPSHTSEATPIGRAPSVMVESSAEASKRRITALLKSVNASG